MYSIVPVLKRYSLFYKLYYLIKGYDKKAYADSVAYYKDVDLILDISGYGLGSDWDDYEVESYLHRIMYAKAFGINIYLLPQSFGPFEYKSIKGKIIKRKIKKWLQYPTLIFAREHDGYSILTKDFNLKNVKKSYDLVLSNKGIDLNNIYVKTPELCVPDILDNSVAIIPNTQNEKYGNTNEIQELYVQIIGLLRSEGKNVYILRHSNQDLDSCKRTKARFEEDEKVILLTNDYSCIEFNSFIPKFDFVVASRFHAVVHAYKNCVPSVTLGWAVKYSELHETFQQEQFVFNIRDSFSTDAIINSIKYMIQNYLKEKKRIKTQLNDVQKNNFFDSIKI
jgi:colanic acid/amylovoran biosynthesis protein